jgi:Transcriptional regulator
MAMQASEDARGRLAASVKKLLNHVSLERLSVMEITEDADVSRQTFYRHFRDKYDLVNWCFDGLAKQCFEAKDTRRRAPGK